MLNRNYLAAHHVATCDSLVQRLKQGGTARAIQQFLQMAETLALHRLRCLALNLLIVFYERALAPEGLAQVEDEQWATVRRCMQSTHI
jgi:hypothetical protein